MTTIFKLSKLALAIQQIASDVVIKETPPADRIIVVDVSGSMYGELRHIREQLKAKIKELFRVQDSITLIWFSGRNDYGIALEQMFIHSLADFKELFNKIDSALSARGLTGFTQPLQEVQNVIKRIRASRQNSVVSMFFMTDGYDNQGRESEILSCCEVLAREVDAATIVEYGWYCNHELLTKMAETMGAALLFSKNFDEYSVQFESDMTNGNMSKKKPITLEANANKGYVYYLDNNEPLTVRVEDGIAWVPEHINEIAYFTDAAANAEFNKDDSNELVWAGLAVLSQKKDSDAIFDALREVADVALIQMFTNCFSKEDYVLFQKEAMAAANDASRRYLMGYDKNAVPKDDAFTVLDMIALLSANDENKLYVSHEAFSYEKIGAERVARETEEGGAFIPKFEISDLNAGYPLNGLVWNESRPNLSIRIVQQGTVALPANRPASLPAVMPTYRYRNFTIVKDGIVHTRVLPMSLDMQTFDVLKAEGVIDASEVWQSGKVYVLSFPKLPVINRKMVKKLTSAEMFDKVLTLQKLKGTQKVLNDLRSEVAPKQSVGWIMTYGQEAADWLKAIGITEYNGFNPPSVAEKSGDFYPSVELDVKIKGLSSLPKVEVVRSALEAGKSLRIGEFMMADGVKMIEEFKASPIYTAAPDQKQALISWIEAQQKLIVSQTRQVMNEIARDKFSIMVGHSWFTDAEGDEVVTSMNVPGYGAVQVSAGLKQVEIAL